MFRRASTLARKGPPLLSPGKGGVFPSPGTREVLETLGERRARVLDLGPADEGTLAFLGGCRFEVEVADLEPDRGNPFRLLSTREATYDAVLAWDLPFRVDSAARAALADSITRCLLPGGALFLILPLAPDPAWSFRFRIRARDELEYRPGRGRLLGPPPSNREVLRLFPELRCTGARILRHGAREFVLRRPAA